MLVVQNDPDKSVGAIGAGLARDGVALDVRSPDHDLPPLAGYAGLIVLPGLADPVDDDAPVHRARGAIQQALDAGLPVLGLCLGGQLLVQALGGSVYRSAPELGFGPVFASPAAVSDPLLGEAPDRFLVFHAHTYAFEPPQEAQILLRNDICVQACRQGEAWAFQCHPEVSREWVAALAAGMRGEDGGVPPETAEFFRRNGISPAQLERDAQQADPIIREVAVAIGSGFAKRVIAHESPPSAAAAIQASNNRNACSRAPSA